MLLVINLPLLTGAPAMRWAFIPEAVRAGEWWRVLTHPFLHLSGYHLACDVAAFLFAYAELRNYRWFERLGFTVLAGAGSLLAAMWAAAPMLEQHGLCGLSGIAHGLTALVGLELWRHSQDKLGRWAGALCFLGIVGKCIFEAATGQVLFASWHLGYVGVPVTVTHAGGVLGVLVPMVVYAVWSSLRSSRLRG